MEHKALRKAPSIERRPAVASTVQRSAVASGSSTARNLQQRIGNRAAQNLASRSIAAKTSERNAVPAVAVSVAPSTVQCSPATKTPLKVSRPSDPAELEAEETARKVMRMKDPPKDKPAPSKATGKGTVQRSEAAIPSTTPPASTHVNIPGGSPLPTPVRSYMEPRFGANFGNVRIHTNQAAAQQSANLNANAFTVGEHVYFGQDKFQPQSDSGRELIAHELTHTVQQGAAVQRDVAHRSAEATVAERTGPQIQGDWLGIPNPRDYFARQAALIPGFTLLTVIIGFNPINNARVERNAGNLLRGAIDMMPGGALVTQALANHGIFDRVSAWASTQFQALMDIGSAIVQAIENFIKGFSITDLADFGGLWEKAKGIVLGPINRIIAFVGGLFNGIVTFIKDAILKPIAEFAKTTRGYPLLCAVMGKDPITGEAVPQGPEPLLGAFLKFIGEEETWNTMQKANAIPRAFAWFNGALNALRGFVSQIPGLFLQAFRSLTITDIILIPQAFAKLAGVFGGFAVRFVTWGATAVWNLLEIIFDVVSPGALAYIKKTGAALRSIFRNPLPFMGNLVKAAKLGFSNFASNFLTHLKAGLIDWLTGSLPGIYIPKAFSLGEIAKFVFSVLGLTWANIRQRIVKLVGEPAMKAMETGFDIVVTLVRDGPAAAWDKIKEQLANLKDMVIGGITDFVVDMVVKKAIPKLIAMFIPGAGFISAILSIYDTVMVFVNKIKQIIAVVTGFIDSIVAIAAGQIGAAATRVENALAGVLSLAINFLAGFAGLGKVADKIMGVINKIRAPIFKALDWLAGWIVTAAKKLFAKVFGKKPDGGKPDSEQSKAVKAKVGAELAGKSVANAAEEEQLITSIYTRFSPQGLKSIKFVPAKGGLDVIVSASAADRVAKLSAPELPKIYFLGSRMKPFAKKTSILVSYDLDGKSFGPSISNKSGEGHAETRFKNTYLPELIARIRRNREKLKTPVGQAVPVTLDINRTPCDGCATANLVAIAKAYAGEIRLIVNAASITKADWQSAEQTSVDSVVAMLDAGIEINASKVWEAIQTKLAEFPQYEFDDKMYDKGEINTFKAEASGVQRLIDDAMDKIRKRTLKSVQKGG